VKNEEKLETAIKSVEAKIIARADEVKAIGKTSKNSGLERKSK
jgi:hypothetical protein